MNSQVDRDRLEVRRRSNGSGDGSVDRGPRFDLTTFLELQRMRVARLPAMTQACMPEEPIRWTERPAHESPNARQKRQRRDKAKRWQAKQKALRQACAIEAARQMEGR